MGNNVDPLDLFGSMNNMRTILNDVIVLLHLHDLYCCGNIQSVNALDYFVKEVYSELTLETKVSWLTKLIYAKFQVVFDLALIPGLLTEHSNLLTRLNKLSGSDIWANICKYFYDGIYRYNTLQNSTVNIKRFFEESYYNYINTLSIIADSSDSFYPIIILGRRHAEVLLVWSKLIENDKIRLICQNDLKKMLKYIEDCLTISADLEDQSNMTELVYTLQYGFHYIHGYIKSLW